MPRQLEFHMERWNRKRQNRSKAAVARETHVVMFRSEPVGNIKRGIQRAAERAMLDGVTPHVLKHSAITHAVMGVSS